MSCCAPTRLVFCRGSSSGVHNEQGGSGLSVLIRKQGHISLAHRITRITLKPLTVNPAGGPAWPQVVSALLHSTTLAVSRMDNLLTVYPSQPVHFTLSPGGELTLTLSSIASFDMPPLMKNSGVFKRPHALSV